MTYEERQKAICKECTDYNTSKCPYVIRSLRCPNLSNQMDGWELGWQDAIDKACEWIEKFAYNSVVTHNIGEREKQAIIITFKEYIEEQQ